jgi:cardiolipin synthase
MPRFPLALLVCFSVLVVGCSTGRTEAPYQVESKYGVDDPQFAQTVGNLLGPPLLGGNAITTLVNGDVFYPSMLSAIRGAKKTITFETFTYWKGMMGDAFTDALCERARAGVKVHVVIDAVGSDRIRRNYIKQMGEAGVEVKLYHPLKLLDIGAAAKLNNRTHRKIMVVDGVVGFTGGAGVADEWMGNAQDAKHWRDTHYRVEGPAVAQLQRAFCDNWMETTGRVLHGEEYFPAAASSTAGQHLAQVFESSSQGGSRSMQLMFLLSIACAQKNIRISTPYFVPDDVTIRTLLAAKKRGVSIQIIVAGKYIDYKIVRRASRARWGGLLQHGVEIYEYEPTMYHAKLMIVDELWTSIGSANVDHRSFRLNDEANLNVLNGDFAREQIRVFEMDLKSGTKVTYEMWKKRPFLEKFMENSASLLGPMM